MLVFFVLVATLYVVFGAGLIGGVCGGIEKVNENDFSVLTELGFSSSFVHLAQSCLGT